MFHTVLGFSCSTGRRQLCLQTQAFNHLFSQRCVSIDFGFSIDRVLGARWGWNKKMVLLQRWCRLPNRYIWFQFSSFALVLWGRTSALFCSSSTFKYGGASLVLATSLAPPRREQIEGFSVQCKGGGVGMWEGLGGCEGCRVRQFRNFVSFRECLGLPVEGFEKEVESLLRKPEVRKGRRVVRSSIKRRPSSASRFESLEGGEEEDVYALAISFMIYESLTLGFLNAYCTYLFIYLQDISDELDVKVKKYLRGEGANLEALQDKKLKGQLVIREELYGKSAKAAAKAEKWLMPSEGGYLEAEGIEKTWRIKQESIAREVDILSSKNQYDIVLPELGPYTLDFTSSGRYMAVGGRKGHLAIIDMKNMGVIKDFQVSISP
ncbi:U3 small nucleolar RNA-associated protein 7 [Vitis vinifera]|uniref:U3 small nucleolar RNA-associated protein 7 n=1 Tax=Vitis vinifera TaxID=29760 RepID=A0A438CYQ0_VITVI|nr:U3 small nucleolar RNA-associated protein 7 [Vitis vinifera]